MEYLKNKCRACLEDSEQMYGLFDIYENDLTLCDILQSCVNVKLNPSDALSSNICLECAIILTNFYNFSITFKENYKKLTNIAVEQNNHDSVTEAEDNPSYELNDEVTVILTSEKNYDKCLAHDITEIDKNYDNLDSTDRYEEIIVSTKEYSENIKKKKQCICNLCKKTFKSIKYLELHLRRHEQNKKFICEICGYVSYRKSYLDDHMEGHSTDRKYTCEFCNKTFQRRTTFCRHRQIHLHPYKFVCEKCGKKFNARDTLNMHIFLRHIKSRNHKCIICNETFALKATLEKHLRRHQQKDGVSKQFSCNECSVKYFDKSSLNRHYLAKHRSTKLYKTNVISNENTIVP